MDPAYFLNRHVYVIVSQRGAIPLFVVNSKLKAALILARFDYTIGPCLVYRGDVDKSDKLANVTSDIAEIVTRLRKAIPTSGKEPMPDAYTVSEDPALETHSRARAK
jgi:hypothetical protein